MKNILIILILATFSISCKAQTVINNETFRDIDLPSNAYVKDINNNHDAIVGTWKWLSPNGDEFELVIEETEMYPDPHPEINQFWDEVHGKYKYVENGIEKVNVLNNNYSPDNAPFSMSIENPLEYRVLISDLSTNKTFKGEFKLISSTTATIEFRMMEGLKIVDPSQPNLPFSLPTSMILTKQ